MLVEVFYTPEQVPRDRLPDCAVAIDVLRATTTIATALAAGAEGVQVFADLESLKATAAAWDPQRRILVGERGGATVPGFDLGNSPLDCTPERVGGKRLFMSTTNGTRALTTVAAAKVVITAAFVNLDAVVTWIQSQGFGRIWLVGSGWEGAFSLEDTACAGAVLAGLDKGDPGNDEAVAALSLYQHWRDRLFELLCLASHGQRLLRLNPALAEDIRYAVRLNHCPVLPRQTQAGVLQLSAGGTGSEQP